MGSDVAFLCQQICMEPPAFLSINPSRFQGSCVDMEVSNSLIEFPWPFPSYTLF